MTREDFVRQFAIEAVGRVAWEGLPPDVQVARIAEADRALLWLGRALFEEGDAALLGRIVREGAGILKVQHAWRLQDIQAVIQVLRGEPVAGGPSRDPAL